MTDADANKMFQHLIMRVPVHTRLGKNDSTAVVSRLSGKTSKLCHVHCSNAGDAREIGRRVVVVV